MENPIILEATVRIEVDRTELGKYSFSPEDLSERLRFVVSQNDADEACLYPQFYSFEQRSGAYLIKDVTLDTCRVLPEGSTLVWGETRNEVKG